MQAANGNTVLTVTLDLAEAERILDMDWGGSSAATDSPLQPVDCRGRRGGRRRAGAGVFVFVAMGKRELATTRAYRGSRNLAVQVLL